MTGVLRSESWDPPIREALQRMVVAGGSLAALDFDRTCLHGDVSETALAFLARRTGRDLVAEYEDECRADLRRAYVRLVSTLIAGRTVDEARAMALEALDSGDIEIRAPMQELVDALHHHGWDVRVVTASAEVLVQPLAERMGIPADHVHGMRSPLAADGRYADVVLEPITFREGKREVLRIATGRDPDFAAGDSGSDAAMLSAARYALLLDHGDAALRAEAEAAGWWIQPGERVR